MGNSTTLNPVFRYGQEYDILDDHILHHFSVKKARPMPGWERAEILYAVATKLAEDIDGKQYKTFRDLEEKTEQEVFSDRGLTPFHKRAFVVFLMELGFALRTPRLIQGPVDPSQVVVGLDWSKSKSEKCNQTRTPEDVIVEFPGPSRFAKASARPA